MDRIDHIIERSKKTIFSHRHQCLVYVVSLYIMTPNQVVIHNFGQLLECSIPIYVFNEIPERLNSTERPVLPLLAKYEASIKYQKLVVMKISEPSPLL